MGKRDTSLDLIKYILVCLVVLGHMLECTFDANPVNEKVYSFIYSFHMPAFILLSGYFFKKQDWKVGCKSSVNLLLVAIIFQILYFGDPLGEFVRGGVKLGSLDGLYCNVTHFYKPVVWYIVALAWWRILFTLIPSWWLKSKLKLLAGTIILSVIAGWVPLDHAFVFQRTLAFFPYFVLGYLVNQAKWLDWLKSIKWYYPTIIVVFYSFIIWLVPHIPLSMLEQCFSYWSVGNNPLLIMVMRFVSYIWQLPLALSAISLFMKIPKNSWFVNEGKYTLFVYVYHAFLVYFIHKLVVVYDWNSSLICMLVYLAVVMISLSIFRHIPLLRNLLNPIKIFATEHR
ncbi:MAG: acyltransferase family protein [Bacteroidaceae bacterium]|nr:acyltransferase family protein [Bacteroidaceae bacterium]